MDPQQLSQEEERDQAQYSQSRLFISVPFEIMLDERLTLADKFIYGRALFFHELFESVEKTAAFIGISVSQAQKSKLKLEKLGFLRCIEDTGRGKRYKAIYDKKIFHLSEARQATLAKNAREISKICEPASQNLRTEIKERLNGEESLSLKDKSFKEAQAPTDESGIEPLNEEQPKSYGKAEINDLLELWLEETGFDHKSAKAERYAINNLLRKNGYEATKALIRRVGRARRSDSQFAPQIAKPSQLQGKYSKLEALVIWEEREAKKQQAEIAAKPAGPIVPRFTPYEDAREGKTEEELRAECQAIRDKYKGTKFEKIFGGRK